MTARTIVMILCVTMLSCLWCVGVAFADASTRDVSTFTELQSALSDTNCSVIEIKKNITITAQLNLTRSVTIHGNSFTLSVPSPGMNEAGTISSIGSGWRIFYINNHANVVLEDGEDAWMPEAIVEYKTHVVYMGSTQYKSSFVVESVLVRGPLSYPLTAPVSITANGLTAAVTFSPASPVTAETLVAATVTLTGTPAKAATHTIGLSSTKAGTLTPPAVTTLTVKKNIAPDSGNTFVFSFTMPAKTLNDFVLTHTFTPAPIIDTHPQNQSIDEGETATFTIAATGDPTPGYQWQASANNGANWSNVTDGTGGASTCYTTIAFTAAMNGYQYRCIVSNGILLDAISNTATLTVIVPPVITFTTQPCVTTTVTAESITGSLTAAATASDGGTATLNWYACDACGTPSGNSLEMGGTFTLPTDLAAGRYDYLCQATYTGAETINSGVAPVTMKPALIDPFVSDNAIMGIAIEQRYTLGDNVTFTAVGGGMSNSSPNNGNRRWLPTAWATNLHGDFAADVFMQTFSTTGMSLGTHTLSVTFTKQQYNGLEWATLSPSVTDTKSVNFVLAPAPSAIGITVQPTDQRILVGQQATFNLSATGDELTYQWSINRNNGRDWVKLDGKTGTSYTTTPVTLENNGYQYGCLITDAHGNSLQSSVATLYVSPAVLPPKTGDNSNPMLWLGMCLLCGLCLVLTMQKRQRT